MNYSEQIKKLRTDIGMSQEDLAGMLCVTRQTVSKWEQGINEPDIDTLKKLSEIFGVTVDEIVGTDYTAEKSICRDQSPSKLQRAGKALLVTNVLLAVFCMIAAVVLWNFVLLPKDLTLSLNLYIQNGDFRQLSPTPIADDTISILEKNSASLLFIPTFAVICGLSFAVCAITKRFFKARIATLSVLLAAQITLCATMFAIQLAHAELINQIYLMPMIMCLAADIVAVAGAACHPRLLPPNELMGVRTDFTMQNAEAWRKVNTLLAYALPSCCVVFLTAVTLTSATNKVFLLVGIGVTLLAPTAAVLIYHEILRKRARIAKQAN